MELGPTWMLLIAGVSDPQKKKKIEKPPEWSQFSFMWETGLREKQKLFYSES